MALRLRLRVCALSLAVTTLSVGSAAPAHLYAQQVSSDSFARSILRSRYDSLVPVEAFGLIDSATALLGLPQLRTTPLADLTGITREIRIWRTGTPRKQFLRLADSAGSVVGLAAFVEQGDLSLRRPALDDAALEARDRWLERRAAFEAGFAERYRCSSWTMNTFTSVCIAQFEPDPDWSAIMRRIDALEAWRLPDPALLPHPIHMGFDGAGISVEVRTSSGYRTYYYWEPGLMPWPEYQRAAALMVLVGEVLARAQR